MDVCTPLARVALRLAARPARRSSPLAAIATASGTVMRAIAFPVALTGVLVVVSLTVSPLSLDTAEASTTRSCKGQITGPGTGLGIIRLKVTGAVKCSTARVVARRFDKQIAKGKEKATVHDRSRHAWRCRITQHATGTDPGYIPYTSVRCTRGQRLVRFKLAS